MTARVRQLLPAASPNDAVTNQALAWQGVLGGAGIEGEIAAEHIHPDLTGVVMPLASVGDDEVPTILRYSIWSPALETVRAHRGPVGIVYHNITPPHLIGSANQHIAMLCARGRRELPSLAHRATLVVADSRYNAHGLQLAGYPEPRVIPLLLDLPEPPGALAEVPARVLYVGRIAPSKRIEDVLRVVAVVHDRYLPQVELDLIGSHHDNPAYFDALTAYATDLGIGSVVRFRGRVDDAERDRAYAESGAYLSMSEHEGFCAPLLEAMARGLPVVARGAAAVPETVGSAGLLVEGADIELAAAAVARVLTDARVREGLAANARVRLSGMQPDVVAPMIVEAVGEFVA